MEGAHDGGSVTPVEDEPTENLGTAVSCPHSSENVHWDKEENHVLFRGETKSGWAPQLDEAQLAQLPNLLTNQSQSTPEASSSPTPNDTSSGPCPGDSEGSFDLLPDLSKLGRRVPTGWRCTHPECKSMTVFSARGALRRHYKIHAEEVEKMQQHYRENHG